MSGDWEVITISVAAAQEEELIKQAAQGETDPGEAARKAQKGFPKRLSDLLDEGWEVMSGDSDRVHLRKRK